MCLLPTWYKCFKYVQYSTKFYRIYEVTAVENGVLARDELLKEDGYYDIVLLDLMMP